MPLTEEIKESVVQILKEEIPHFMKMAKSKAPESVRTDLRNDAISGYIDAVASLEEAFSAVNVATEKIQSEYGVSDAGKDAYPFRASIDDMYKKVVHWSATQTEILTNRYLNA